MLGSSKSLGKRSASSLGKAGTLKLQQFQTREKIMSMKIPRHTRKQDNLNSSPHTPEGVVTKGCTTFTSWASKRYEVKRAQRSRPSMTIQILAAVCSFLWPRKKPGQAQMATTLQRKTNLTALEQNSRIHIQHSYPTWDSHSIHRAFCLFILESNKASGKICKIKYQAEHLQTGTNNRHPRPCVAPGLLQNCPLFHLLKSVRATQELRVHQEGAGDTRPLLAQQKEGHKLVYKDTWTTNISVPNKITDRTVYSLPIPKHENNIMVYSL